MFIVRSAVSKPEARELDGVVDGEEGAVEGWGDLWKENPGRRVGGDAGEVERVEVGGVGEVEDVDLSVDGFGQTAKSQYEVVQGETGKQKG